MSILLPNFILSRCVLFCCADCIAPIPVHPARHAFCSIGIIFHTLQQRGIPYRTKKEPLCTDSFSHFAQKNPWQPYDYHGIYQKTVLPETLHQTILHSCQCKTEPTEAILYFWLSNLTNIRVTPDIILTSLSLKFDYILSQQK